MSGSPFRVSGLCAYHLLELDRNRALLTVAGGVMTHLEKKTACCDAVLNAGMQVACGRPIVSFVY